MRRFKHPDGSRFRPVHHEAMLELLGFKGASKWPDAGVPARLIQGIWVHVLPVDHASLRKSPGQKSSAHRVMACCPDCGRSFSAGRMHQHKCLQGLARAALLTVYDTQEHDDAHNAFGDAAERAMTVAQRDEWHVWNLKATSDEIVYEALRILGLDPPNPLDLEAARKARACPNCGFAEFIVPTLPRDHHSCRCTNCNVHFTPRVS